MHFFRTSILLVLSALLVFSCSAQKKVAQKPPLKVHGLTISKGIKKKGSVAVPIDPTTEFSPRDEVVVAHIKIDNLSGTHNFRWDWYAPGGELYYSTADFPFNIPGGKYSEETTAWHSLTIKGDKAASLFGNWEVKVYINADLVDSHRFVLTTLKETIELTDVAVQNPVPSDWGLIIGIEEYAHLPSVDYATKDALIIRDYFLKVLRIPEENIITLIGSDATKAQMEGYLENYLPGNVRLDSTLYVYFVGHGAPGMNDGDPYLVPFDGDTRFIEQTGYKLQKLYNDLGKMNIKQSYVFLDSCFSGTASRAAEMLVRGTRPTLMQLKDVEIETGSVISLSATSAGQTSNAYADTEHGLFTYYLLKGLKGAADADEDRWVSIKEMYEYVSQHVPRVARRMGTEQTPSILPPVDKLRDVAIGRVLN
jgi:hypothetical protein